ncbi:basic form of pathogenesis-related protein 1-like [Gastrolobium bilobum]|uniref:basic form of pathogenesis-related protein 1-like n=1 Tax=Gastrolobium bilobum TaxID=150636 RepID=UPI002AB0BEB6|nr:basic form of pathogenesis-related protein 1-like [Gastrolobium bilobum]
MRSLYLLLLTIFSMCCISLAHYSPQDFLDPHNEARAEVGVGPLSWNDTLEAYAQNYANSRIQDCNLVHSYGPYGENVAEVYGEMTATDAVKLWVAEKPNYDHNSNSCVNGACLHYTQVIWRDTVHLGCARAVCNNGWIFVICSYDPPGNIEGQRPL